MKKLLIENMRNVCKESSKKKDCRKVRLLQVGYFSLESAKKF